MSKATANAAATAAANATQMDVAKNLIGIANASVADKSSVLDSRKATNELLTMVGKIAHPATSPLATLWTSLAPYVALGIVVMFLITMSRGGFGGGGSSQRPTPGQRTRSNKKGSSRWRIFNMRFNPFAGRNTPSIPRNLLGGGRCDNVQWLEDRHSCYRTTNPPPLKTDLNVGRLREIAQIHPELVMHYLRLRGIDVKRLEDVFSILTPWELDPERGIFTPKCSVSVYNNQSKSPARLWRDVGNNCIMNEEKQKTYTDGYRPNQYTHLEDYATACTPRCSLSEM